MHQLTALPKYKTYKDSEVEWLGEVPRHWKILKANYLFATINERSNSGSETLLTVSEHGGVRLRAESNVNMFMALSYIGYKICRPGDLVINSLWAWSRGLGISKYHGIISTAYSVYRPNHSNYDDSFLNYLLRTEQYVTQYLIASKGIWISRLQLSDWSFLRLPIISPPKKEQTTIANFLDKKTAQINKAIAIKEKQIQLLKEYQQTIIQKSVTQGLDPNVPMKDSGVEWIGKIPQHWRVKKGKWIFLKVDRKITKNNEIITCFRDGIVTLRKNRRTEGFTNALKEHGYQGVRKGDLVIHAMDAFAGAIGVSDSDGKSSPVYSVCVPQNKLEVDTNYYSFYLRHLALIGFIESLAKGIRERSTDFRFKDFTELFLPIPPKKEQLMIVAFLQKNARKINNTIKIQQKQIQTLKEYKSTLINSAVTGKIKVS